MLNKEECFSISAFFYFEVDFTKPFLYTVRFMKTVPFISFADNSCLVWTVDIVAASTNFMLTYLFQKPVIWTDSLCRFVFEKPRSILWRNWNLKVKAVLNVCFNLNQQYTITLVYKCA